MMLGQPLHLQSWLLVSIGLSDSHIVTTSVSSFSIHKAEFLLVLVAEKNPFFPFSRSDGFFFNFTCPKMLNGCPFKNGGHERFQT